MSKRNVYKNGNPIERKDWISSKEASRQLGVSIQSLRRFARDGKLVHLITDGGHRRYSQKSIEEFKMKPMEKVEKKIKEKESIAYCRVSSYGQSDDLERQVEYMEIKYPNHRIITDIGSGINFKRKGLREIIKLGMENKLKEVVVTYKDRLCRIGYDLIEYILKEYSNAEIKIDSKEEEKSEDMDIAEDIMEILTVYSAKISGRRSRKKK